MLRSSKKATVDGGSPRSTRFEDDTTAGSRTAAGGTQSTTTRRSAQTPLSLAGEDAVHAVRRLRTEEGLGEGPVVCILGGTSFTNGDSEELVRALAKSICMLVGRQAVLVTGGMPGVQQTFAESCTRYVRLFHLLPAGQVSGFSIGKDVHAGGHLEERKVVFGMLGDIYLAVEGGPGVSSEARTAFERGAIVVPMMRSGGASAGMFNFPAEALQRPVVASEEQWQLLRDKKASTADSATAAAQIIAVAVEQRAVELAVKNKSAQLNIQSADFVPGPSGEVPSGGFMCNERTMTKAFEMLDVRKERALGRPEARKWLRCVGWNLPLDDLNDMLDGARPGSPAPKKYPKPHVFTRLQLVQICEQNRFRPNGDKVELGKEIQFGLNSGQAAMSKKKLLEIVNSCPDSDLTATEMDELLYLLGFGNTDTLDCAKLGDMLLEKIAKPPGGSLVNTARDPANRAGVGFSARARSTIATSVNRPRPNTKSVTIASG